MNRRKFTQLAAATAVAAIVPSAKAQAQEWVEVKIPYEERVRTRPARSPSMLDRKIRELHTAFEKKPRARLAELRVLMREVDDYREHSLQPVTQCIESEPWKLLTKLAEGGIDLERPFTMEYVVEKGQGHFLARQVRDRAKEAEDAGLHARMLEAAKIFQTRIRQEMAGRYKQGKDKKAWQEVKL